MTLREDQEQLREAVLNLAYGLVKPVVWLLERLGGEPQPWVRERQIRERHAKTKDPD